MDQKKTEITISNENPDNPIAKVFDELWGELGLGSLNELFEKAGLSSNTKMWYSRMKPDLKKAVRTRKKDLDAFIQGLYTKSGIELNPEQIVKLHEAAGITNFSTDPASYKPVATKPEVVQQPASNALEVVPVTNLEEEQAVSNSDSGPAPESENKITMDDSNKTVINQSGSNNLSVNIQNATVIYDAKFLQSATIIQEPKQVTVIDRSIYEQTVRLAAERHIAEARKGFILPVLMGLIMIICLIAGIALLIGFLGSDLNSNSTQARLEVIGKLKLDKVSLETGEYLQASFTIANTGEKTVNIESLEAGVRFNSDDWSGQNFDFPTSANIKLEPKETYTYQKWRTFANPGKYFAEPVIELNGHWGGITNSNRVYFNVVPALGIDAIRVKGAGFFGNSIRGALQSTYIPTK